MVLSIIMKIPLSVWANLTTGMDRPHQNTFYKKREVIIYVVGGGVKIKYVLFNIMTFEPYNK